MSQLEIAITSAVIGGVSGAIVAGLLSILSVRFGNKWNMESTDKTVVLSFKKAENLINKQEFFKAAAEFQAAFTEEIRLLRTGFSNIKTQHIIKESAVKHENAMIRFRHHLPEDKLSSFDNAWAKYQSETYSSNQHDTEGEKSQKRLALDRIQKLLEFAK